MVQSGTVRYVRAEILVSEGKMADSGGSDDDEPRLSEYAFAALSEFYAEQTVLKTEEWKASHSGPLKENWVTVPYRVT